MSGRASLAAIEGGRAPGGWEELWSMDRWPVRKLPHGDLHSDCASGAIRFAGLGQPWLKEAAKRWVRVRLLSGTAPISLTGYVEHLQAFSEWLSERAPAAGSPAVITRELLEDYLLAVRSSGLASGTKNQRVGVLRAFLDEQRDDGLAGLAATAVIYAGELPKIGRWLPRGIEPGVFEQFIDPANLALLSSEQHRTVILLLAFTGLRVSSIVTLPRDALQIGSDNHPYLRYLNVKLGREAVIPIGPALREQLHRQERCLDESYGAEGTRFLLPARRRRDGRLIGGQEHPGPLPLHSADRAGRHERGRRRLVPLRPRRTVHAIGRSRAALADHRTHQRQSDIRAPPRAARAPVPPLHRRPRHAPRLPWPDAARHRVSAVARPPRPLRAEPAAVTRTEPYLGAPGDRSAYHGNAVPAGSRAVERRSNDSADLSAHTRSDLAVV